jgi:hypothetical protein
VFLLTNVLVYTYNTFLKAFKICKTKKLNRKFFLPEVLQGKSLFFSANPATGWKDTHLYFFVHRALMQNAGCFAGKGQKHRGKVVQSFTRIVHSQEAMLFFYSAKLNIDPFFLVNNKILTYKSHFLKKDVCKNIMVCEYFTLGHYSLKSLALLFYNLLQISFFLLKQLFQLLFKGTVRPRVVPLDSPF